MENSEMSKFAWWNTFVHEFLNCFSGLSLFETMKLNLEMWCIHTYRYPLSCVMKLSEKSCFPFVCMQVHFDYITLHYVDLSPQVKRVPTMWLCRDLCSHNMSNTRPHMVGCLPPRQIHGSHVAVSGEPPGHCRKIQKFLNTNLCRRQFHCSETQINCL